MVLDARTGRVLLPTIVISEGIPLAAEPIPEEVPSAGPTTGIARFRTGPVGTIGAAAGLLAVVNEMLAPYAAVLEEQRRGIQLAQAEITFWLQFGAQPTWGIWDERNQHPLPFDTPPKTGIFSNYFPYLVDINVDAFRKRLPQHIANYQEFVFFLDLAQRLGAIVEQDGRYRIVVNWVDRSNRKEYDITATIEEIRAKVMQRAEESMRSELRQLPPAERGEIFRLRSGSKSQLFRSAEGMQPILSAQQFLGSDPWVRVLGRRVSGGVFKWFFRGHYQERVLVAPANGDAFRASVNSAYSVKSSIEDVLAEVRASGRPILSEPPPGERLESFVAGPDSASPQRFGITRYQRDPNPELRNTKTVAIGELKQFYVNADELAPVDPQEVIKYREGPPAKK